MKLAPLPEAYMILYGLR